MTRRCSSGPGSSWSSCRHITTFTYIHKSAFGGEHITAYWDYRSDTTSPSAAPFPQNRERFEHSITGTTPLDGTPVTVLVATEVDERSIIRDPGGFDLPSVVTAWIDANGRLLLADVRSRPVRPIATTRTFVAVLQVRFKFNPQLEILVPSEMSEGFWSDADLEPGTAVAKYKDYRRFQTAARILPQG